MMSRAVSARKVFARCATCLAVVLPCFVVGTIAGLAFGNLQAGLACFIVAVSLATSIGLSLAWPTMGVPAARFATIRTASSPRRTRAGALPPHSRSR